MQNNGIYNPTSLSDDRSLPRKRPVSGAVLLLILSVAGGRCFVCGSVTTITRNCMHRSSPNWVCIDKGSDHLQLIKFWRSCVPGKGVCSGSKFFGSALLQPTHSVCVFPSAFFISPISGLGRRKSYNMPHCTVVKIL